MFSRNALKKICSLLLLPALVLLILPFPTFAIDNLLPFNSIKEWIMSIINNLLYIVAGVTVVVIIIAGIMYIFSGANSGMAEKAKKALMGAVLGFAIVVGAQILISQVGCALGWKGAENCEGAHGIIARTITFIFSLLAAIGIGGILVGAIFYFSSSGEQSQMEKGKKIVVSSLIGTIIALSAALIVRQVEKFFM